MARRRFFVPAIRGGQAELRGEDARHLTRVLRAEPGRQYEISDGQAAWLAEIAEARGDRVVFRVVEPVDSPAPPLRMTLCAALIKFDRFEWIVEKATELGVERILPVETTRSEKGLVAAAGKRRQRWERIAFEAGQQARRLGPPEILPAVRFQRALEEPAGHHYFLEETTAPPLLQALPALRLATDRIVLLAGPEGGWTDPERELAAAADWQAVSLGPLVLRAETAALAGLAVIGAAWMR
ncbi:MAG: 16S rRNA (uracil(1498)-N(3))-methyltransferase [Acidobacteriia bacterium]|nr:16S rRNA (uracil(1498)-N(3))-methyltransferase [Terriglobia bacterium]